MATTTTTPVTSSPRQLPAEPESGGRKLLLTAAYVLEHNLRRLIILAIAITLFVFFAGSVRNALTGVVEFVGSLPGLVIGLVFSAFALIAQFAFLMFFLSRPRTYTVLPDAPQIGLSFENYRGQPDLLEHAKSLVRILRGQESFKKLGGDMPKGMLLSGPPGTGKTFLAGVVAAEANLPFIYVDASSLRSMWMGVDALIIMSLFGRARKLARKYAPPGNPGACILFMDEIDSIGQSRGGVQGGQTQAAGGMMGMGMGGFGLNTLLNQMDSLAQHVEDRRKEKILRWLGVIRGPVPPKPVVFVMGATNRPDVLDAALVRPGRLDRRLNVYAPDADGRRDILRHYLSSKAHDQNISVDLMVADSIGWTPIDIKTVINEALIVAHDAGRDFLTYKDWLTARDTRLHGIKQPILSMSAFDRRTIAYHEAGHAIVALKIPGSDPVHKVTIVPRGRALGLTASLPEVDRHNYSKDWLIGSLAMFFGGRVAEEIIFGADKVTTGAGNDIERATGLARRMVTQFGMSELIGPLAVGDKEQEIFLGREFAQRREISERTAQMVDDEVKRLIDEAYARATIILSENRELLDRIAATLLERETIDREDLDRLLKNLPLAPRTTLPPPDSPAATPTPAKPSAAPTRAPILGAPPAEPAGA